MLPPHPLAFFFGNWKTSSPWAANWLGEQGLSRVPTRTLPEDQEERFSDRTPGSRDPLNLPGGQVVCLIPVGRPLDWSVVAGETGRVEPGSATWVSTQGREIFVEEASDGDAILVGMPREVLASWLEPFRPGLAAGLRELVYGHAGTATVAAPPEVVERIVPAFREPPVSGPARAFWYESQIKALLALLCFVPAGAGDEFFCSRQKRLARVRVARAKATLEAGIDGTFDLNRLASEVGCSPSYLSRTFSATTGMTISHYLRKRRIEKAADLLASGRCNVSEAALEVGYQSLSHFSKAFQQVKGCLPSKYEAA